MIINVQNTQEANYSVLTHCKCIFGGYQEYVLWATNHLEKQTNVYQLKNSTRDSKMPSLGLRVPHGSLMYNKISGWQVIWSNFTSNMILYRLKLTLLHRYSNIQFQWYIESTSSRHALSDGCFNLKRRSWRHWPAMKAPSTLLSVPNGNEVLEGCSRNLVNMMET